MIIGRFTQEGDSYEGSIETLALTAHGVSIEPATGKQGNKPDYNVLASTHEAALGGYPVRSSEIGAAWKKTSKAGKPYLSVKLDGPTLAAPLNCALTKQEDGSFALLWNRESRKEEDAAA